MEESQHRCLSQSGPVSHFSGRPAGRCLRRTIDEPNVWPSSTDALLIGLRTWWLKEVTVVVEVLRRIRVREAGVIYVSARGQWSKTLCATLLPSARINDLAVR